MSAHKSCCRLTMEEPRIRSVLSDGKARLQLPDEIGQCFQDFVELEPGLGLGRLHYRPTVPLIEETSGPHEGRVMVITVGMKGRSCYDGQESPAWNSRRATPPSPRSRVFPVSGATRRTLRFRNCAWWRMSR